LKLAGGAIVDPELHRKVVAIFADIFQIEINSDVEDIDRAEIGSWDSVSHLRLVAEIEEVFETALSDEEVTTIECLRDVEKILLRQRLHLSTS
jgi:acyl carrier protein